MDLNTVYNLLSQGGAVGVAAISLFLWWLERQERRATTDQLLELAQASIEASSKTSTTLESFGKTLDRIVDRIDTRRV